MYKFANAAVGLTWLLAGGMAYADVPACTAGADYEPICGIAPPEDLALSADGRHLFMSITPGLAGQHESRLRIMDLVSQQARDLPVTIEPQAGWGEASCAPSEKSLGAHGISLSTRSDGRQQLLVVNHNGRETIEFLEVVAANDSWSAIWRGCVEQKGIGKFNDVAATPNGGFVATVMFESPSMAPPLPLAQLLDGRDTGYLMSWSPGQALSKLEGSESPFPNGVQVSADGRYAWFAAWTAKEVRQFDLQTSSMQARLPVGYMVDNLSWGRQNELLGAGIIEAETFQRCFSEHVEHCPSGFQVSAIDTEKALNRTLYTAAEGVLAGASVAVDVAGEIYVGSYTGDRLVRLKGIDR